jgi:hypothetical protein
MNAGGSVSTLAVKGVNLWGTLAQKHLKALFHSQIGTGRN